MKKYIERDLTNDSQIDLYVYNAQSGDYARFYVNGQKKAECNFNCSTWQNYNHGSNFKSTDKIYVEFYLSGGLLPRVMLNFPDTSVKHWFGDTATTWAVSIPTHGFALYFQLGTEKPTPSYFETLDKLDQWSSAQYVPKQ